MNYATIASAVDFAAVLSALGTVAAAVAGLYLAIRGGRTILSFIRR